jgi:hypothetical protein
MPASRCPGHPGQVATVGTTTAKIVEQIAIQGEAVGVDLVATGDALRGSAKMVLKRLVVDVEAEIEVS